MKRTKKRRQPMTLTRLLVTAAVTGFLVGDAVLIALYLASDTVSPPPSVSTTVVTSTSSPSGAAVTTTGVPSTDPADELMVCVQDYLRDHPADPADPAAFQQTLVDAQLECA